MTALHAKIGQLPLENDFLEGGAQQGRSVAERKTMLDRVHRLSVSRQARLLGIRRGSVYYQRRPAAVADLLLMRRLDALHLDSPFAGSRMLQGLLRQEGHVVGRLPVATLLKRMGLVALYRRPTTSPPTPGHQLYPSLLRTLAVTRPNQVWAMDITSVPLPRGFVSRVAAWRDALAGHGTPESRNTDQGRQVTAVAFLTTLQDAQIAIRMDGTGAWRDNVVVERLWRTIKYEEVSLRAYGSVSEARSSLDRDLTFYNRCRPHSALGGQTPDQIYFNPPTPIPAAA